MRFTSLLLIINLVFITTTSTAQIGIGTQNPNNSALLDVTSTSKGLLPPRMTKSNRNAISAPPAGLTIWCNNCGDFGEMQVYNGTDWTNMTGGAPAGLQELELFGGGIVIYILQPSDSGYVRGQVHGLVAALNDAAEVEWGCHGSLIGTFASIGTGYYNTEKISLNCPTSLIAARVCYNLVSNNYSDWHLPSKDELNKLYERAGLLNILSGTYWSSTEGGSGVAYAQNFSNGFQYTASKPNEFLVRPVRWF